MGVLLGWGPSHPCQTASPAAALICHFQSLPSHMMKERRMESGRRLTVEGGGIYIYVRRQRNRLSGTKRGTEPTEANNSVWDVKSSSAAKPPPPCCTCPHGLGAVGGAGGQGLEGSGAEPRTRQQCSASAPLERWVMGPRELRKPVSDPTSAGPHHVQRPLSIEGLSFPPVNRAISNPRLGSLTRGALMCFETAQHNTQR